MKQRIRKLFWAWEFEKEEKWLNEFAKQGYALTDVGFCRYDFEPCDPGAYEYRLEFLEHFPSHKESADYIRFMEETGYAFTVTDYWTRLNGEWLPYISTAPDKVGKGLMNRYVFFSTITVMYEREKIGLIQIEPVRHNNDYAMWLDAVEKCKCYRLPECLSYYIRHDNSVSSGRKTKQLKNLFTMWRVARGKSSFVAAWLTLRNMFWFLIRRSVFKRNPDPSDEEAKRMFETACAV